MTEQPNEKPDAIPEAFKARFRARLADRATAFEQALADLSQNDFTQQPAALAQLHRLAHSLKGAARQYEFDDLADQAQVLEATAENTESESTALVAQTQALITHCRTLSGV